MNVELVKNKIWSGKIQFFQFIFKCFDRWFDATRSATTLSSAVQHGQ
jgi:hypothetical protein